MALSLLGPRSCKPLDVSREVLADSAQRLRHDAFRPGHADGRARLVEAGSRFVSVFWDEYGLAGPAGTPTGIISPDERRVAPGFDGLRRALIGPGPSRSCWTKRWSWC